MSPPTEPDALEIRLTPDELRYLVSCGIALIQHIPEKSLPTYAHFSKQQIMEFSSHIRRIMDENGLDM